MRKATQSLGAVLALVSCGAALGQSYGYDYDWQSGNSYSWNRDAMGNTRIQGFNGSTGNQWNTTVRPNGDMRGWDAGGNAWSYDGSTGTYMNYGTGRMCTGSGALRSCF